MKVKVIKTVTSGNKSIKLKPVERKAILEVPSIREYIKIYPDKRALA